MSDFEKMISEVFAEVMKAEAEKRARRRWHGVTATRAEAQTCLDDVLARCEPTDSGCWEWQGASSKKGYGRIKYRGRLALPHRVVAYAMGTIKEVYEPRRKQLVIHKCDNPRCCNPAHLDAGTNSENMKDCVRKGRMAHQKGAAETKA